MLSPKLPGLAALFGLAFGAAGCSSDISPLRTVAGPAQEAMVPVKEAMGPMKQAIKDAGYGPKTVETPDFVEKSRTSKADYMPVGESAPKRAIRARSNEARKNLEADLENARTRNEARGNSAEGAAKAVAKGLKPAELTAE